jgi:YidC/Oxa1 family membrane protein insertase
MDIIVNPFVTLLTFLYSIFNDMVLSIVVFTILIRLLTYPLTRQQMRSSAAMTELQPELKKLQEKYKGDREKIAQEQMRLYREYGVNPLGGCLPLLIQFPIFIGLYQAIIHALTASRSVRASAYTGAGQRDPAEQYVAGYEPDPAARLRCWRGDRHHQCGAGRAGFHHDVGSVQGYRAASTANR